MQVSWIEADDLKNLVEQLREPASGASLSGVEMVWELETKSEPVVILDSVWKGLVEESVRPDGSSPPADAPAADLDELQVEDEMKASETVVAPTTGSADTAEPSLHALSGIRDRLRAIRERALAAGLLARAADPTALPGGEPSSHGSTDEEPSVAEVSPVADGEPQRLEVEKEEWPTPQEALAEVVGQEVVREQQAEDEIDSFEVPLGSIGERLEAYCRWAQRRLNGAELLLMDDHGDVLWGQSAQAGLVLSVLMASMAAARSSALAAFSAPRVVRQTLANQRTMTVIPCPTCYGLIHLAVMHAEALDERESGLLREALIAAMQAQAPGNAPPNERGAID